VAPRASLVLTFSVQHDLSSHSRQHGSMALASVLKQVPPRLLPLQTQMCLRPPMVGGQPIVGGRGGVIKHTRRGSNDGRLDQGGFPAAPGGLSKTGRSRLGLRPTHDGKSGGSVARSFESSSSGKSHKAPTPSVQDGGCCCLGLVLVMLLPVRSEALACPTQAARPRQGLWPGKLLRLVLVIVLMLPKKTY